MISGPNDTPDMLDYPSPSRASLEAACNEYAETVYKLREENKRLSEALHPFTKLGAGLYFDMHTRRDGMTIIKCQQCNGWTGKEVDDFCHESDCPYTGALIASIQSTQFVGGRRNILEDGTAEDDEV